MSANDIDLKALDNDLQNLPKPTRGWFGRNWKWFLPVLILLILVAGGGSFAAYYFQMAFGNEAYKQAMAKIAEDAEIKAVLGEPIKPVYFSPPPSFSRDVGNFDIRWAVTGSKETQAKAHVKTRLMSGKWETVLAEVELPDGKKVMLDDEDGGNVAPPYVPPVAPPADGSQPTEPAQETMPEEFSPTIPSPEESK